MTINERELERFHWMDQNISTEREGILMCVSFERESVEERSEVVEAEN